MMNKGITTPAYIPLRGEASHTGEMTSQLLFGEIFDVIEKGPSSWSRVRNPYDGYEGWICLESSCILEENAMFILDQCTPRVLNRRMATLKKESGGEMLVIPAGCILQSDPEDPARVFTGEWYRMDRAVEDLSGSVADRLAYLSGQFLNSPYLWGGRSTFGTDCSGLVQTLFRILGIPLKRDTGEQHKEGKTVNLLAESAAGDLVFFDDENGQIVHAGVLLDPGHVLHASGLVRIDPIDHQGIYKGSTGSYSHKLRLIKRIINSETVSG